MKFSNLSRYSRLQTQFGSFGFSHPQFYRPISLTSVLDKLFEKIINKKVNLVHRSAQCTQQSPIQFPKISINYYRVYWFLIISSGDFDAPKDSHFYFFRHRKSIPTRTLVPTASKHIWCTVEDLIEKLNEAHVIVTKADKANTVVLLDRPDYDLKMHQCMGHIGATTDTQLNFISYNEEVEKTINCSKYISTPPPDDVIFGNSLI